MTLNVVVSDQTNPYWNVAVENCLVERRKDDCVTMYLWKNHRTVVVGQNQNPFAECDVERLMADGGYVMRRTTGGGAVYHDDGNINFSFIAPYSLYDMSRQFDVIRRALRGYGLEVELSGRNDLVIMDGGTPRKFSGNAFSKSRWNRLHHGTLLIKGNMEDLSRYLKVKPAKLHKHGVASVQSRVVNLSELADISSENIVAPLIKAFEEVYCGKAVEIPFSQLLSDAEVGRLYEKYSSDEWLFGRWRGFNATVTGQFDWGGVELRLAVDEERSLITGVDVATDSLDVHIPEQVEALLTGCSTKEKPSLPDGIAEETARCLGDILSLVY